VKGQAIELASFAVGAAAITEADHKGKRQVSGFDWQRLLITHH